MNDEYRSLIKVLRRMKMVRKVFLFTVFLFTCCSSQSLPRISDEQISHLPGSARIMVLNFWATWCTPCRTEIPMLNRLAEEYPDVHFVGVNMDDLENEGAIPGFLKENPIHYEIVHRVGSSFEQMAGTMDPNWKTGIPATFVFQDGQRIYSRIGIISEPDLENVLKSAVDHQQESSHAIREKETDNI